jgi:hypothetical protein
MLTKIVRSVLALTLVAGVGFATSEPANSGDGGRVAAGVAVGTLLGLGIAGAYGGPRYYPAPGYYAGTAYYPGPAYGPGCYPGPRQCGWSGRSCWYSRWGEYICGGGAWHCWRPTICD